MQPRKTIALALVACLLTSCGGGGTSGDSGIADIEAKILSKGLLWCEDRAFSGNYISGFRELKDPTTAVKVLEISDVDRANGYEFRAFVYIQWPMFRRWAGKYKEWLVWEKGGDRFTFPVFRMAGGELEVNAHLLEGDLTDQQKALCEMFLAKP